MDETVKDSKVFRATDEQLDDVLKFIAAGLDSTGCNMSERMQIEVAAEEIFVNIAHYAYAPGTGDVAISRELGGAPTALTVSFIDEGAQYNPLDKKDPDVTLDADERQIGGLGIFLVKNTMDIVRYKYTDGKNILTLIKYLNPRKQNASE